MSIVKVQPSVSSNEANSGNQQITLTLSGVAANSLLTLQFSGYDTGSGWNLSSADISDTGTATWAVAPNQNIVPYGWGGSGKIASAIYYAANVAAGTHAVTFTAGNGAPWVQFLTLTEWSGLTATPGDVGAGNNVAGTNANTVTTGGSVAQASELILACIGIASGTGVSNASINTPSGFTQLFAEQNTQTYIGAEHCYQIGTSLSGTQSAAWTWTDASTHGSQSGIATFLSSSGGGGGGPTPPIIYTKRNVIQLDQTIYY